MYPEYAEIDGIQYKMNTDYRYALACFRAIEDEELTDIARAYAVISILFGIENPQTGEVDNIPENISEALRIAEKFLRCGSEKQSVEQVKKDMDFEYDKSYIVASFMSDYRYRFGNS